MRSIRWGVLGVANIGVRTVIPAIQRAPNARLIAIASRTPARAEDAARRLGIPRAHGSYEALLADPEVEAVYIPLPNSLHREWTIRCAEAGKHVLCEKPLALTAREAEEMAAACRQHGVALMEAFMYRFHPRTERVGRLAADGALGDVRMVRAAFTFAVREPDLNIRFRRDLGGGALYDVGCYTINVSRMVLGEPELAFAAGRVGDHGVDEQVERSCALPVGAWRSSTAVSSCRGAKSTRWLAPRRACRCLTRSCRARPTRRSTSRGAPSQGPRRSPAPISPSAWSSASGRPWQPAPRRHCRP